jgi:hypothetical protein
MNGGLITYFEVLVAKVGDRPEGRSVHVQPGAWHVPGSRWSYGGARARPNDAACDATGFASARCEPMRAPGLCRTPGKW